MTASDTSPSNRLRARERFGRIEPAAATLAVVALVWIVVFSVLVVRRHEGFWDFDFDMGIQDQSVWLLARGRGFLTVRGLQVFGHHFSPGYFLLSPASWLGSGPNFLNVLQVNVLALGTVPLFLLARDRGIAPWPSAALGAAFLLHPAVQFFSWELFHPEVIAITPLLCAYLCARRRSWRWFAAWTLLAICWKEDVALVVIVLGLVVAWRGDRRIGLATAGLALAWFVAVTIVLLPAINGGALQSEGIYSGVGGSAGGVLSTAFSDPGAITSRVFAGGSADFAWRLLLPFGLAPLLAPLVVVVGVPQFLLNVVSDVPWTRTISTHYAALPIAALALATVEGAGLVARRFGTRRPMLSVAVPCLVLGCALYGTLAWGPSPVSAKYRGGWWPPVVDTRIDAKQDAIAAVPRDASVSAVYTMVPHLSRRAEIYSFPNPWRPSYYGVPGSPRRDPARVEWLVVDRQVLDTEASALLESVLSGRADDGGRFRIVLDRADVLVARRARA
ncbi:MAG TPA: DUF2079 domain-containing protein [Acidimicrobiia bacterium]|nr:DUF2079 domain-containing protein [Acidimicrobiia bacterium]